MKYNLTVCRPRTASKTYILASAATTSTWTSNQKTCAF